MSCTPVTDIKCPSYHTHISPTTTPLRCYYHHSLFTLRTHTHTHTYAVSHSLAYLPFLFALASLCVRLYSESKRKYESWIEQFFFSVVETLRPIGRPTDQHHAIDSEIARSLSFFCFHFLVYGLAVTRAASNNQKTQYKYNNQRQYISDDVSYGQMIRKRNRSPSIFCRTQEKLHRL